MIEVLNWISANPKMALGILVIVAIAVLAHLSDWADRKYGERF